MEALCPLCGLIKPRAEFVPDKHKASGYASRCRQCDNERSKKRYWENRDEIRAKQNARRAALPPKMCLRCGVAPKVGTRFCAECSSLAADERRKRDNKRKRAGGRCRRTCRMCGQIFRGHGNANLCANRVCKESAREARKKSQSCVVPWRACGMCDRQFIGRHGAKYCSDVCRTQATRPQHQTTTRPCLSCGHEVVKPRRVCDLCALETKREERRRRKSRARARRMAVEHETYTLAEIAARDQWICGICGKKVEPGLTVPHPDAPTRDHILPMALGGADTRANVQLAHFLCNSIKGDRVDAVQLRLVAA